MGQRGRTESEIYFKWNDVIPRMKKEIGTQDDRELREFLGLGSSNFSNYKNSGRVPQKWILNFAIKKGIPFEKIVRHDVVDVPEIKAPMGSPATPPSSEPRMQPRAAEFPPQYERRRWLKLRQLINEVCSLNGVYQAMSELIEMGLPNVTPIVLREIHRRNPVTRDSLHRQ